jgi:ABC-type Mn2+/Zn2+ transport system permease subunit/Mn-dependent DtxR family transcriptional regulator
MEILEVLQFPWAIRALIAASLVGVLCGTLGVFIVLRNMSLIGDALAHAILPGIVIAFVLVGYSTLGFFIGAVAAGLLTAVAITWIQHNSNTKNDAAIGIAFTTMFAIGVMGISSLSKNEGVHLDLKDFLFGNILGVSDQDLIMTSLVTIVTLSAILLFYRPLFATTFQITVARTMGISVRFMHYFLMLLLSFAVVASLRTVGVILVVAMLITPAATALLLAKRLPKVILISGLIGLLTAITGFVIAILFQTTPGPAMTVCGASFYLLALIFAPDNGLLSKLLKKRAMRRQIVEEDLLKHAMKSGYNADDWIRQLQLPGTNMKKYLQLLSKKGMLIKREDNWELTDRGREKAGDIIRAHRLWETYLVEMAGMKEDHIHEEAENAEHWLPAEVLDDVEQILGYPEKDPHGSPIPPKGGWTSAHFLWNYNEGTQIKLHPRPYHDDASRWIEATDLDVKSAVTIADKTDSGLTLSQGNKKIKVDKQLATHIMVLLEDYSSSGEPI